jgi:phage-related protein/predicted XRE-type DNA-binding protein
VGGALGAALFGEVSEVVKKWKGEGSAVFEIVEQHDGNAYRAVYAAAFKEAVDVLHAFQKKSSDGGSKTDQRDIEAVRQALKGAQAHYKDNYKGKSQTMVGDIQDGLPVVHDGSDNVFADPGLPDADENEKKVRLAVLVNQEIRRQGLRQIDAAELLKANQAEVSRLVNYKLSGISEWRLMCFLNALGQDVEIGVRPARSGRATITVRELGAT